MTEKNDKLFPCNFCRFQINGLCRRNPPVQVWDSKSQEARPFYPFVEDEIGDKDLHGCFSGEPREPRTCNICIKAGLISCMLYDRFELTLPCGIREWHCSEWEGEA